MIEKERIKKIQELSDKLGTDSKKLIDMMQHHTEEIKELFDKNDTHFAVEAGDLIVLAIELLMKEGYSIEEIMDRCYDRFDKKLNELAK
jgi:uncharacterized protein YabN with tetrapyrrole methylase and pyrophosphatase domain